MVLGYVSAAFAVGDAIGGDWHSAIVEAVLALMIFGFTLAEKRRWGLRKRKKVVLPE